MSTPMPRKTRPHATAVSTADAVMRPAPIEPRWILDNSTPVALAAEIACAADRTTSVYLWETSGGTFRWEHESDETVIVLEGEAFVADEGGPEHRLGPQDVAFFPRGARTVWRVPHRLRKISTLTQPLPAPAAEAVRWLRRMKKWGETRFASRVGRHPTAAGSQGVRP